MRPSIENSSLYLIAGTAQAPPGEFTARVAAALEAGVDLIQFREKSGEAARIVELGREIAALCRKAGRPLVVNDDPALARALSAWGLHLGQDDMAPVAARAIVGPDCRIGLSTHSLAQYRAAQACGEVAGLGLGPIFTTRTKDAGEPLGPAIWSTLGETSSSKPTWAIGGIDAETLPALVAQGCRRIAVSSAILGASDVALAVTRLLEILKN